MRPGLLSIRTALTVVEPVAVVVAGVLVLHIRNVDSLVFSALTAALVCQAADLQRSRLMLSVVDDVPGLALASVISTLTLAGLSPYLGSAVSASLADVLLTLGTVFGLLLLVRSGLYMTANALRRRGLVAHPVIIVGTGPLGRRMARALLHKRTYGLVPIGMVDDDPDTSDLPVPLLGKTHDLKRAMLNLGVDDVIFAVEGPAQETMTESVRRCVQSDRQVFVVSPFVELLGRDHQRRTEIIHDMAIMRLRRWGWRPQSVLLKRLVDVTLSALALVLTAPVLLVASAALRLETRAGVLFRQTRVGQGGRHFTLLKFQTMRPATPEEGATTWNVDNDARIGPVGRFLRRTGLDELPQLVNVLRGDMSVVGPRPERPHFVQQFSRTDKTYQDRHRVQAGITGLAQVHDLRGDTSISERVRFDNSYIENYSLWNDLKIMWRTVPTFVRSQPAGRDIISAIAAAPREASGTAVRATQPS